MDPALTTLVTLAAPLMSQITSGILGNRSDALFCDTLRRIRAALQEEGVPVNHELQRAVRQATLQALLYICERYRKELESPASLSGVIQLVLAPPTDLQWINLVISTIQAELLQVRTPTYLPPSSVVDQQLDLLLQPHGGTAHERAVALRLALEAEILSDLERRIPLPADTLPPRVVELLQSGWEEPGADGKPVQVNWFALNCAFFAHYLKQNPEWHLRYLSQLLTRLSGTVTAFGGEWNNLQVEMATLGQGLTERLEAVQQQLLAREERLQGLQSHLNAILPTLVQDMSILPEMARTLQSVRHLAGGRFVKAGHPVDFPRRWHDDALIEDLINRGPFVGRQEVLTGLTQATATGGYLLVTAPAGGGKSTVLAHWVRALREMAPTSAVIYHFFSTSWGTHDINGALACLTEQLLGLHSIQGDVRESEPGTLRTVLHQTLQMRHPTPVLVVLDALDEAQDQSRPGDFPLPQGLLPPRLGQNVVVLFSIRTTDGTATAATLRAHLGIPTLTTLSLPSLDQEAVQELLRQSFSQAVRGKAEDAEWVTHLLEKTGGLPIYLRHLIEQLSYEPEPQWDTLLHQLPRDVQSFISQAAKAVAHFPAWRDALCFLALAPGPLSTTDLRALTVRSGHPLTREDIEAVPWSVKRWLEQQEEEWAFQHLTIAEAYSSRYLEGQEHKDFMSYLLDYGAAWESHRSAFVLRHYPSLLQKAVIDRKTHQTTLYNLARNDTFLRTQDNSQLFSDALALPLHTLQMALLTAIEADDAGTVAEFLLRHARRVAGTRLETPMEALNRGQLLRAWLIAELYPSEQTVLWHLLIAWQLKLNGMTPTAQEILYRLYSKGVEPLLEDWQQESAIAILSQLWDLDEQLFLSLCQSLLSPEDRIKLARIFATSEKTVHLVKLVNVASYEDARVLSALAITLAKLNNFTEAHRCAELILKEQHQWSTWLAIRTLLFIVPLQFENGYADVADHTFERVTKLLQEFHGWELVRGLALLASAKGKAGKQAEALALLETAQQKAHDPATADEPTWLKELATHADSDWATYLQAQDKIEAICAIATAFAATGKALEASSYFREAEQIADNLYEGINDLNARLYYPELLETIIMAQTRCHLFDKARVTAEKIPLLFQKFETLTDIALEQIQLGNSAQATTTLNDIYRLTYDIAPSQRTNQWLSAIALVHIQTDTPQYALTTVQKLLEQQERQLEIPEHRANALWEVTVVQLEIGNISVGENLLQHTLQLLNDGQDNWSQSEVLANVALVQSQLLQLESALATIRAISVPVLKAAILSKIALLEATAGRFDSLQLVTPLALTAIEQEESRDFRWETNWIRANLERAQTLMASSFSNLKDETPPQVWQVSTTEAPDTSDLVHLIKAFKSNHAEMDNPRYLLEQIDALYREENRKPHLYIVTTLIENGLYQAALQFNESINTDKHLLEVLVALAKIPSLAQDELVGQSLIRDEKIAEFFSTSTKATLLRPLVMNIVEMKMNQSKMHTTKHSDSTSNIAEPPAQGKYYHILSQLLVTCAYYLDTAYDVCALLAHLYPQASEQIGFHILQNE